MEDLSTDLNISWWDLSGYSYMDANEYPYQKFRSLYKKGWLGLTAVNLSQYETSLIRKFTRKLGKDAYLYSEDYFRCERLTGKNDIGEYLVHSVCVWLKNPEDKDDLIEIINNMTRRDFSIKVPFDKDNIPEIVKPILKKKNYWLVEGDDGNILTSEHLTDAEIVMIKMFC